MGNALWGEDPLFLFVKVNIPVLEAALLVQRRIELYPVDQLPSRNARAGFEPKTQTNNNYSDLITKFHATSLNMKHSVVWNFVKTRKATTLGDSIFEEEGQTSAAKHD